ncbi:hypothetical protein [Nonomuraea sp. NPDC005650]
MPGCRAQEASGLDGLTFRDGMIADLTGFVPDLFEAFGLPTKL